MSCKQPAKKWPTALLPSSSSVLVHSTGRLCSSIHPSFKKDRIKSQSSKDWSGNPSFPFQSLQPTNFLFKKIFLRLVNRASLGILGIRYRWATYSKLKYRFGVFRLLQSTISGTTFACRQVRFIDARPVDGIVWRQPRPGLLRKLTAYGYIPHQANIAIYSQQDIFFGRKSHPLLKEKYSYL